MTLFAGEQGDYLAVIREAAPAGLGKDRPPVGLDLEYAAGTGDKGYPGIELPLQFFFQPGSAGAIVSLGTVGDGDLHG
ncbi:MAG: hypothetical protein L3J03_04020 [Desulfobacterales bacterium]|nr:hypothetical protein [Desulfobacterales bacterium]